MIKTNVIITMAGLGSRFRNAGYDCPKYVIEAHGKSLFQWSMLSLEKFISDSFFIFIVRLEDNSQKFIREQCAKLKIENYDVLEISSLTDGQATSALLAHDKIQNKALPSLVYNIDTFVDPSYLVPPKDSVDGWIPCFPGLGDGWSFVKVDPEMNALEIREKVRISEHATVGLYWFSSFNLFVSTYNEFYQHTQNVEKGERYIAPMYNYLLKNLKKIRISTIPYDGVIPLGTPEEVERFKKREKPSL